MTKTASVEDILLYEVQGNDDCEGRGPRHLVAYYTTKLAAEIGAEGKGPSGSPGYVRSVPALKVSYLNGHTAFFLKPTVDVKHQCDAVVKREALQKIKKVLSDEEIKLLGIKE